MIGILTEKPSAMRNFETALGGASGTYNGESYVITASHGHLFEYNDPEDMVSSNLRSTYHSWDLNNLPWDEKNISWKRSLKSGAEPTVRDIDATLRNVDEIVIATDDDPSGEGELLAWEILDYLGYVGKTYSRMYFVDESPKSIQDAFIKREPIYSMDTDNAYQKACFRSKWDYLSMQFTRIATKCGDGKSVLRQGRLKSAMVLLVGTQLDAVNAYKKIPAYQNRFKDEHNVVYIDPEEPKFEHQEDVPQTYASSKVILDSRKLKHTAPPKLIDLAALSAMLGAKGYKSKEVMDTYQAMYEDQIVSYPRSEDKTITPEQFKELLPKIKDIAKVVGVDPALLTHTAPRPTHVKAGGAHGANRPGPKVPNSLSELSIYGPSGPAIYETLAKNYLAMLAEDYEYEQQKGHLEKYPTFIGTANIPRKPGYKAIFADMDDNDEDENQKGLGKMADPFVAEIFPPKPENPTMRWLMKRLEKENIGTGATRTSIYTEVTDENTKYPLLIDRKGKLSMTKYGTMSYMLLPNTNIGSLTITKQVQDQMQQIESGTLDSEQALQDMQKMVIHDIDVMTQNGETMRKEMGITMDNGIEKEKVTGLWQGRDVRFTRTYAGHRFTDEEVQQLLDGQEIEVRGLKKKDGGTYDAKGHLEDQTYNGHNFVGFKLTSFLNSNGATSSKGSNDQVHGVWNGQEVDVYRTFRGHTFTDEEMQKLFDGDTITVECKSATSGNTYMAKAGLAKKTSKAGREYIAADFMGFDDSGPATIPDMWSGHKITSDEKQLLESGSPVRFDDCVSSKTRRPYSCLVRWKKDDTGKMRIVPDFADKVG